MKRKRSRSHSEVEVNMTPMLDIVFIMLIFFIVSSSFVHESGLALSQHKTEDDSETEAKSPKAVIVKICANRDVYIDQRIIDIRSVRANIERKLAEDGSAIVIIQSEADAPTSYLVLALNQVRATKADMSVSPEAAYCGTGRTQ